VIAWKGKTLVIALLLCAAAASNAVPTIYTSVGNARSVAYPSKHFPNSEFLSETHYSLTAIGRKIIQAPVVDKNGTNSYQNEVKPLPDVPAGILMAITGFLCVSLVRDRKVWLSAVTSLLCCGQAGVSSIPHLAMVVCRITHTKDIAKQHSRSYPPKIGDRTRNDIDETYYIGLIRYLAGIPEMEKANLIFHKATFTKDVSEHKNSFNQPVPAIIEIISSYKLLNCLDVAIGQNVIFNPAFIAANLARGPPCQKINLVF